MKLYLLLCFLNPLTLGIDLPCLRGFAEHVYPLLDATEEEVKEICDTMGRKKVVLDKLEEVLVTCGMSQWQNDVHLGIMIKAIFSYVDRMLCSHFDNTYCFPHAIKIINKLKLLGVLTNSESKIASSTFSWDDLDLECSVFADKERIANMCPVGDYNSNAAECIRKTIREFDDGLILIENLLKFLNIPLPNIPDLVKPLKKFAKNIRISCDPGVRGEITTIFENKCGSPPSTPVTQPTEPELKDLFCKMLPNFPGQSWLRDDVARLINVHGLYELPGIQLPSGQVITRTELEALCCDATCQQSKKKKLWNVIKVLESPSVDLCQKLDVATVQERKQMEINCCRDALYNCTGSIDQCVCKLRCAATQRRLLTNQLVANITVEGGETQEDTLNCVPSGNEFSLDNAFNTGSTNTTSGITQVNCECSPNCVDPTIGATPSPPNPTAGPTFEITGGAMSLSFSLVAMFWNFFLVNTVFGK